MKQYVYNGDVKLLKNIDNKFQKLYARNYKSYSKNNIIMYVISKMALEFNNVNYKSQATFIDFILKNQNQPKEFWVKDIDYGGKHGLFKDFPIWYITKKGNIVHKDRKDDEKMKIYNETSELSKKVKEGLMTKEERTEIIKGWYETKEFMNDAYMIDFDDINQIIELNNLHPLELIEI